MTAGLVWLDVFSHLDREPSTLDALCAALGLHARPADVMVTLFAAMGLVVRDGGVIHLTPLAREHFVHDSPYSLAAYYASFKARPVCRDLVEVLRTGKPAGFASARPTDWLTAMLDPAFADGFTAAMDARGLYLGPRRPPRSIFRGGVRSWTSPAGRASTPAPSSTATRTSRPPCSSGRRSTTWRGAPSPGAASTTGLASPPATCCATRCRRGTTSI